MKKWVKVFTFAYGQVSLTVKYPFFDDFPKGSSRKNEKVNWFSWALIFTQKMFFLAVSGQEITIYIHDLPGLSQSTPIEKNQNVLFKSKIFRSRSQHWAPQLSSTSPNYFFSSYARL